MSATPGARSEYSRGSQGPSGDFGGLGDVSRGGGPGPPGRLGTVPRGASGLVLAGALLGALLLIVAEFTSLYTVHTPTGSTTMRSRHGLEPRLRDDSDCGAGRPPGVRRLARRRLGGDPGHRPARSGRARDRAGRRSSRRAPQRRDRPSSTGERSPSAGLYLETLGAIVLLATLGAVCCWSLGAGHGGASRVADNGRCKRSFNPLVRFLTQPPQPAVSPLHS